MATPSSPAPLRLDFELTPACDHRCAHCYNVWADPAGGRAGPQLPTAEVLALLEKALRESGAGHATLTGGEPLLRRDADEIVARACALAPSVHVITNGGHVGPQRALRFAALGVRAVQLTLLSHVRERHDALKGAASFDDTLRAALDLRDAGVAVQVCFVALRANRGDFEGVLELCCALGVRAVSYNRMSPSGGAAAHVARLLPTAEDVERDLWAAERLAPAWGIRVATAMPIPPCLIRIERFRHVRFGFCSVGSGRPGFVVGPTGDVRACNLAARVLGNVARERWADIVRRVDLVAWRRTVPTVCRGCAYESTCAGGCKESGRAVYGDPTAPEPFLRDALDPGWRAAAEGGAAAAGETAVERTPGGKGGA